MVGKSTGRLSVVGSIFMTMNGPPITCQATLEYQNKYGWDFIKINPRSSYYIEGWGAKFSIQANRMKNRFSNMRR
jgi:hypothetical protein